MTDDKITEADLAYLRNIDTRPGPNAGGAIDKRLPPYTPASADVIEGMREAMARIQRIDRLWVMRTAVSPHSVVVEDDGRHYKVLVLGDCGRIAHAALRALSDEPPESGDPEDRDPNERVSIPRIEILNRDKRITKLTKVLEYIAVSNSPSAATAKAALALPDSKPDNQRD